MSSSARVPRPARRPKVEVVAHDSAADAHRLHLAGQGWAEIATRTGYADAKLCAMAVRAYLQRAAVRRGEERRKEDLQLELDRLDALQAAHWERALAGDAKSTAAVLRIIDMRCKLNGFDGSADVISAPRTIVIDGTPEEYVAQLKAVIENDHEAKERYWPGSTDHA